MENVAFPKPSERRTEHLSIATTPTEAASIRRVAASLNITPSTMIRTILMAYVALKPPK